MNRIRQPLYKNKYIGAATVALFMAGTAIYAMDNQGQLGSVYAAITREALGSTLSSASLKSVTVADDSQDVAGSEGRSEKRRHFDGSTMQASIAYINRELKSALNLAAEADTDTESKADSLRHFGLMLHCVQDFYLHTNYVELKLEDPHCKADPYSIPLVDWSKVPDGYRGLTSGTSLAGYTMENPADILNKETANAPGGKQPAPGGTTLFALAKELAARETQRQWNMFETYVRSRCGQRSAAVLTVLREGDVAEIRHK